MSLLLFHDRSWLQQSGTRSSLSNCIFTVKKLIASPTPSSSFLLLLYLLSFDLQLLFCQKYLSTFAFGTKTNYSYNYRHSLLHKMDHIDDLGEGIFVRLLQVVSWFLVVLFSIPAACLATYQIITLYLPYSLARITGTTSYRFPAYMYTVWGDDLTDLTIEHWGYLACCVGVTIFSAVYIIPETPWKSSRVRDDSEDSKKRQ
ncbi:unnamed protein product [Amoebophrya sp. A25]|nr:unnamed protein product [Amoebophrya sp. A25]|eukprot:GSA25T00010243001.1